MINMRHIDLVKTFHRAKANNQGNIIFVIFYFFHPIEEVESFLYSN